MEYEINYRNDERILAEFYRHTVCGPYRKIGIVIILIGVLQMGILICGYTGIVDLQFSSKSQMLLIAMGVAEFVIGIALSCYHILIGRAAMKQGLKSHGGEMPETHITMGDDIHVVEGEADSTYDYRQITSMKETPRMFCIMFGKYSGIALPRSGFVKGDADTFAGWIAKQRTA
ncbi:MAG: YcxB family protein [Anaerovoracaceae bacterium]|jgi:hypothetical protein